MDTALPGDKQTETGGSWQGDPFSSLLPLGCRKKRELCAVLSGADRAGVVVWGPGEAGLIQEDFFGCAGLENVPEREGRWERWPLNDSAQCLPYPKGVPHGKNSFMAVNCYILVTKNAHRWAINSQQVGVLCTGEGTVGTGVSDVSHSIFCYF